MTDLLDRLSAAVHPMWPDRRMFAVSVGDLRRLLALARDAEELREAAKAYIDWRERRAGQWEALANCGHDIAVSAAVCPEWRAVHDEPFDIDERLDDALRVALEGTDR